MATIKDNPEAQVEYLNRKADALKRKASASPGQSKRERKDHTNAQHAEKIVSRRAETANRNAKARGISKPAKTPADSGDKAK